MAGIDYYSCDICGSKTFYDADLSYTFEEDIKEDPKRYTFGREYFCNSNPKTTQPWPDGYVGDMAVICKHCAEENEIIIQKKD